MMQAASARPSLSIAEPCLRRTRGEGTLLCSAALLALLLFVTASGAVAQGSSVSRSAIIDRLRAHDSQGALDVVDAALRSRPGDCELLSLKAIAQTGLGRSGEALQSFDSALKGCPAYLPALEGAAEIRFATQSPAASALLRRILALQPSNVTAQAMLATLLRKDGRCAEAIPHLQAAAPLFPSRPDLLESLGACLAATGDDAGALTQYRSLLEEKPDDATRYNVALLQWKTHAPDEALATLAPLLAGAGDEAALALAARIHESRGDTPQAVALLRSAILLNPDHVDNYLDFADIAFTHKSFQVGIDMLNAGLGRLPNAAPLYVARGVLEVQVTQMGAAVADFEKAHRLDPKLSFAVDAVGIMQSQQHHSGQSLALFREQAKRNPGDPLLQYLLAEQLSGESGGEGEANLPDAIAAARLATKLDPKYTAAHDLLAVLYLRAKQPALAVGEAELALALDPNDQNALYQEIMARRRTGQTAQIPELVERMNQMRRNNDQRQLKVDRYRLQESATPPSS